MEIFKKLWRISADNRAGFCLEYKYIWQIEWKQYDATFNNIQSAENFYQRVIKNCDIKRLK